MLVKWSLISISLIMFRIRFRPPKKFWQRLPQEITFLFLKNQSQIIKVDLMNTIHINVCMCVCVFICVCVLVNLSVTQTLLRAIKK